jgi:hypothetical protein
LAGETVGLTIEEEGRLVEVDLHGYSVETALELARTAVAEAYENGFRFVRLVHGRSTSQPSSYPCQAPTIKEELLRFLDEGAFARYAYTRRSGRHKRRPSSLTLALRPNPSPNQTPIWTSLPERDYPE